MMKKILDFLFSMQLMGILIIVFAVAIGTATFIENDFGTPTARALVYDATWFELVLLLLIINLIGSFVKYRALKRSKISIIIFHFSFIVILTGAAITRYLGYEGSMHIRENKTSNTIRSYEDYLHIANGNDTNTYEVTFAEGIKNEFSTTEPVGDENIIIELTGFVPNATESLIEVPDGEAVLTFSLIQDKKRQVSYVRDGQLRNLHSKLFGMNINSKDAVVFTNENENTFLTSPDSVHVIDMSAEAEVFAPGSKIPFEKGKLYRIADNLQLSKQKLYPSAKINYQTADTPGQRFADILIFKLQGENISKQVVVRGTSGTGGDFTPVVFNGHPLQMAYGTKIIKLPFSLKLKDFILDRYPGSNSPSSFESEVVLIDHEQNIHDERRIYMNNVLKHRGYRFYQSSYDQDEMGTILSVNHDSLGTIVTYTGYLLLSIGMIMALFTKNSRFRTVSKKIREMQQATIILPLLMFFTLNQVQAQSNNEIRIVDYSHARSFGKLLVQDKQGRVEPINTLASEVVRKVSRKVSFKGLHSDQVFLGMILQPDRWKDVAMIKVSHPELKKMAGLDSDYAAFSDFINAQKGSYMLRNAVEKAYAKKPAERNMFDKEVIKVDERINIFYMASLGQYLKIFPHPEDLHHPWYTPFQDQIDMPADDSVFVRNIFSLYANAVRKGTESGDYSEAEKYLNGIIKYQNTYGSDIIPSETKQQAELWYNDIQIFYRLAAVYGLLGFVLLILLFTRILTSHFLKWPVRVFVWLIFVAFAAHVSGLAMRWYLSGHAPWSDGYESLIYIAFATVLAGIIFSRKSPLTLAATAILASIILMVAHLSWMDPEITNLVPVLKSYWLTIHVSIITASYGFFALGALLGFLNLILNLFKTDKNILKIDDRIEELSYINEMTITVGLYMLTIGTFLGGVWANESWGRYWGWDPKETWALVSVLVYAFIVHMRMMPGLKSRFVFNLFTVIGFGSIIMTYFGVNYYLSGLHSYAKGDPVPIPTFVYYTIATIIIVGIFSYINDKKYRSITGL